MKHNMKILLPSGMITSTLLLCYSILNNKAVNLGTMILIFTFFIYFDFVTYSLIRAYINIHIHKYTHIHKVHFVDNLYISNSSNTTIFIHK